ncbi:uncharacterized protein LOC107419494 isoform X2 [Ziziphus jujuba]|uniref:Uncharacterized protein LOC107419494 isoform X2 n=1 Tax=Ziziphus jujuba TaxID=326968 RepID=A0ABM3I774_ZIZJJ|nr:uncharacterized protein LOC107419494 isoform X2 [Ziziphus jujuba]
MYLSFTYTMVHGLDEKLGTEKISVSDHINGFDYNTDKSDSFVIDMGSFSNGANKDATANSRITLQRSFSRKGSQRVSEKKLNSHSNANDKDSTIAIPTSRGALVGSSTPEKAAAVAVGTVDNLSSSSPQTHHQITITAGNISTSTDGRCVVRRNSFRRSSSWGLEPKKVLLFFATLSSMGSILLIYFTLSMSKYSADENGLDWQQ